MPDAPSSACTGPRWPRRKKFRMANSGVKSTSRRVTTQFPRRVTLPSFKWLLLVRHPEKAGEAAWPGPRLCVHFFRRLAGTWGETNNSYTAGAAPAFSGAASWVSEELGASVNVVPLQGAQPGHSTSVRPGGSCAGPAANVRPPLTGRTNLFWTRLAAAKLVAMGRAWGNLADQVERNSLADLVYETPAPQQHIAQQQLQIQPDQDRERNWRGTKF